MHNSNVLHLSSWEAPVMPSEAFSCVTCLPGKVVVEMSLAPVDLGGILLPERVGGRLRADLGTVMGCCAPRDSLGVSLPMSIRAGDAVLVRPYDGTWVDGFCRGGYRARGQVRFYGLAGSPSLAQVSGDGDRDDRGVYETVAWSESIVARVVGRMILPTEGNVLLRPVEVESSVLLPDGVRQDSDLAVVLASGIPTLRQGDLVVWVPDTDMDLEFAMSEEEGDLVLVRGSDCLAKVLPESVS